MYFIDGKFKTGWFVYGIKEIYYFDANGISEDLTILEDIPTTCTAQGHKIVQNNLGIKKTVKYERPKGHNFEYNAEKDKYICSICGFEGINIETLDIKMGTIQMYDKSIARTPTVKIEGLKEGKDFTVRYENNKNPGEAKAIITAKGDYTGEVTKTFIIYRKLTQMQVDLSYTSCEYSGSEKKPEVFIEGLTEGKDYVVSYKNNVNVGEATVTIKGLTKYYTGTVTKTFTITKKDISKADVSLSYTSCEYSGSEKKPEVFIEGLTEGKDYVVSYKNNVNVGEATVTIKGLTKYYIGTVTKTFTITKKNIETSDLDLQVKNLDLSNKLALNIEDLKEGQDYTVAYNLDQDTNSITIKGIGNYKGQKTLKATKDTEMIVEKDGVQYNLLNDGTAEVYNFTELGKKANIKSKIKDYKVTKINKNAFKNCDKLKLVKIPKSVSEIDKDAFKDCKNVTISGKIDSYANNFADENKIDFKESK